MPQLGGKTTYTQRFHSTEHSYLVFWIMTLYSLVGSNISEEYTYLLTPWCRVLLEKLTGLQLLKKYPAFYGTRRFITALTSVRHHLGQPNPVHIPTSHLLKIHPNITHPSTPKSPQWSLSLRFPHQDPIRPPLLPHIRHMPCPWGIHYIHNYNTLKM